jgi:hypothetical protein
MNGSDERSHENPIDAGDVSDDQRARMLLDYVDTFRAAFGRTPKLMPLDSEGKAPWITGRCALDSAEADAALVDGYEAARQIAQEGARGFAIYAGRPDHGTEGVAFVDHDDPEAFPAPTGEPTLTVLSGSGRGPHETYRNDPDDPVRNARVPDEAGEIRAANWYVVVPGSIHPLGGVYHITEERGIATLADADLTDAMRPSTGRPADVDDELVSERRRRAQEHLGGSDERGEHDRRLELALDRDDTLADLFHARAPAYDHGDRSDSENRLAWRLAFWLGGDRAAVRRAMDRSRVAKWHERDDDSYRESILGAVDRQTEFYDSDGPGTPDAEPVVVLPNSPRARASANGWDWRSADRADATLTIDSARERTADAIADAFEAGDRVLIEALPTMGKSRGAIEAAAETGVPVTMLTGRGNQEQYEQLREWCDERGLRAKVLPSVWRDCETFQGEHGEGVEETVKGWYRRGATGKDIHRDAEYELGEPLPCDGPAGRRCSYKIGWEFDPDEFDVLIGNFLHAHVDSATQGRTVVVDEFPGDAFETTLDDRLAGAVTQFVQRHDALPFDDYADLMAHRDDDQRRADALVWFQDHAPERDGKLAFASTEGHAAAPLATFTLLGGATNDLGNGWERATLPEYDNAIGLYDREQGRVHLLTPPSLRYTRGVVALDGTPTSTLWEFALGTRLNHRPVLTDAERAEYVRDTLGLNIVRTTDAVKPYSGTADHVATDQDRALLDGIADEHDQRPSLLTTQTAEGVYRDEGVLDTVRDVDHYGNLKGSNKYATDRLGAVIGSRNFGDQFVQKWGAFAGEAAADPDRSSAENRGVNLSYGDGVGDDVLRHMREHETLQAVMRFGRDGRGATVYVHTNTLPAWIEDDDDPVLAGEGRVIQTWSNGMRQVLDAASDLDEWTTAEIADHPAVEVQERQVRKHLHRLVERGYVGVEIEGNGFVWRDDGLHRVNEYGDVELAPVNLDELSNEGSAVVARSSSYTWNHRSSPAGARGGGGSTLYGSGEQSSTATDRGAPPPDPGG